jgi:hypothetical protein
MRQELWAGIAALISQGVEVGVKPSGWLGDVFVVQLPNGTTYELLPGAILRLRAEGDLSAAGIEDSYRRSAGIALSPTTRVDAE